MANGEVLGIGGLFFRARDPDALTAWHREVLGLDALVARLEGLGVTAERRAEWDDPSTGRFARVHDPEGNAIELWEPPAG